MQQRERFPLKAEAKLNLWQSDTPPLIQCVYFGWRCIFLGFFFFPSSEAASTAEPLFQPRSLFFKRKLRQECCVCYHRRESEALIQHAAVPGSERTQNDTNQSLRRVLREEFLLFWRRCNASPIVRSLARKTHMSSVHRSNAFCVCVCVCVCACVCVCVCFPACQPAYLLTHYECAYICTICVYVCVRGN